MARNERDSAKERFWRGVLGRQAGSGLSVRAFCRREMLAESNFYAWRRVIAKRDAEATPSKKRPVFVPAIVTDSLRPEEKQSAIVTDVPRGEASIVIELSGGRRLRWPRSMPVRRLARLVHALEAGPRAAEAEA